MIEIDLRTHLINDATVNVFIGSRFYLKAPIDKQTQTYCTYNRQNKGRDMVSENNRFQIFCFSKDTLELANLTTAIIQSLEDERTLNGNYYYSNSLINQVDSIEKLDDGFFWSILTFEFKHTT